MARKGFIGPIGDDLPSILIVVLSLGLFFSAVVFSFNAYTDKLEKLRLTEGAVQLGRIAVSQGVVDLSDKALQDRLALAEQTYSLKAETKIADQTPCPDDYFLRYFVAAQGTGGPELKNLFICIEK